MIQKLYLSLAFTVALLLTLGSMASAEPHKIAPAPDQICPALIGSQLPPIALQGLDGQAFDLNRAIAEKPTVLIYFRGGW